LVGVVAGDAVALDTSHAAGAYGGSHANPISGRPVTVTGLALTGADAGNYTLTAPRPTGYIYPKDLTVTGVTALDKVYDGTTDAVLDTSQAHLDGLLPGDGVAVSSIYGTFSSKNVGTGRSVAFHIPGDAG